MEAQGTWVLFYSRVGSVLSQQHRLATSSLSFLSVRRVLSKEKMVRKLATWSHIFSLHARLTKKKETAHSLSIRNIQ